MTEAERTLLASVARAVLSGDRGELANQLDRPHPAPEVYEPDAYVLLTPAGEARGRGQSRGRSPSADPRQRPRRFRGGRRDYVIVLEGDDETPLPWANVIANPHLGTVVTASGAAYTWSENSRENRLSPHANDPSPTSRRRRSTSRRRHGRAWSPTPGPMRRTRRADAA
jgi:cyclic beta-1,2-glucan synthetase